MQASAESSDPDGHDPRGKTGPFIGIGLPHALALRLAEKRPVVALLAQDIALAGLAQIDNAVVACLLLGGEADAVDVLEDLATAGYRGEVLVIAPSLPDADMVERELARLTPGMRLKLLVV